MGKQSKVFRKMLLIFVLICSDLLLNCITPIVTPALSAPVSPVALAVYGQNGSFTTNSGGVSASRLSGPRRTAIDNSGGVYIADTGNNRVLYFPLGTTIATRVYGQAGSFTTNTVNKNGVSANSLNQPSGLALDSSGNLYVADTTNNRVLYFPSGSTTATRVYGQGGSFTTNSGNKGGVGPDTLDTPAGVSLDSSGNLYVADTNNNRVLFFLAGSTTATGVYGQGGNFNSSNVNHGSLDAMGFDHPSDLVLDSSSNLYVADPGNNRVLYFPSGTTTATRVYGQAGSFFTNTANNGGVSANSLNQASGLTLDSAGNLYVADTSNSRVLYFAAGSTTATRVYGQGSSFTTNIPNNGGVSASSLNVPRGVMVDSSGTIYIADTSNNRVLVFRTALRITTQPPTTTTVGSPFSVVASLIDVGSGGTFTGETSTVSVAIKPGSGTSGAILGGATSVAAVNGVATFSNLTIDRIGTGYILTVSSRGVGSADTNAFTVTGALLFIPLTIPSFSFTLNGTTGIVTSQHVFRVVDTLQSGVGWHVAITSTQLTAPGGKTLPTSSVTITQVSSACTSGQICVPPTNTVTGYPITVPAGTVAPAAITYLRAAAGTGTGDVTLTATFSLRVLPGTAAGTYTGTFTETLVKGQ
ncbi:MAG TPA: NHL repeat-containing protein [Ktedonobacteraceae bacterium]|nr:NHL repeat-containing protein [Ktedonobacteraceae bacterium]